MLLHMSLHVVWKLIMPGICWVILFISCCSYSFTIKGIKHSAAKYTHVLHDRVLMCVCVKDMKWFRNNHCILACIYVFTWCKFRPPGMVVACVHTYQMQATAIPDIYCPRIIYIVIYIIVILWGLMYVYTSHIFTIQNILPVCIADSRCCI